jgi:hypothetical protein
MEEDGDAVHSQSAENKSQMRPTARTLLFVTLEGSVFSRTTARLDLRNSSMARPSPLTSKTGTPSWPLYIHGQGATSSENFPPTNAQCGGTEYPILSGNVWQDWVVSEW